MPDNEYHNLGPKTLLYFIFRNTAFFTIILVVLLALWWMANYYSGNSLVSQYINFANGLMPLLIFLDVILFLLMVFVAWWQYKNFKFKMDDDAFKIMRGIMTREEAALPYRRIESIDLKSSLLSQIFGVTRLTIETMSDREQNPDLKSDSNDEVLPIIDRHLAELLQAELTKRANIQKMNVDQP